MNFGELLSYLRGPILHDDSQQIAGSASDALWSDETLATNINEAIRRWCRRTLAIRDASTAAVCQVTLVEGQTDYTLHPSIISVISAKRSGTPGDLMRAGHSIFDQYQTVDTRFWDPTYFTEWPPGAVLAYSTDEEVRNEGGSPGLVTMRVYPEPDATMDGETINLRVVRGPIDPLTLDDLTAIPEIPEDNHIEVLDWAAYLCLRTVDLDEGAPDRAKEFAATFETNADLARRIALSKMFAPKKWGFGRNGWGGYER